jgi:hypothetical protein
MLRTRCGVKLASASSRRAAGSSLPAATPAFYLKGVSPPHVTLNQICGGMMPYRVMIILCIPSGLPARQRPLLKGGGMESALAASAFLGAALVGLAGNARIAGYLDDRRWLRVAVFAAAFFVMAAILTGGPHLP